MDSITHFAIGACMGEVFAGKKLGRKALLWGAVAQSFPDIDFVASFWMDPSQDLLAHRGFTHSLLCCGLVAVFLSLLAERWHRPHNISLKSWIAFFATAVFIHIFLDAFNNYGVGWFEPFSHQRISFNAIYVADPFFSAAPIAVAFFLWVWRKGTPRKARNWAWFALACSGIYLGYCLFNKEKIDRQMRLGLQRQAIAYNRYFSTPAPLQNWLWYMVAGTDSGYWVGFHSLFDRDATLRLEYFPRNDRLLTPVADHEDLQRLIRFSQQFYTVERWGDTLVFNDLRFGQMLGWQEPRGRFVFHYYLNHTRDNRLVVQRGRFQGWNRQTFLGLWNRIQGQ